eukprot:210843-Prymnesium_polylepis.3
MASGWPASRASAFAASSSAHTPDRLVRSSRDPYVALEDETSRKEGRARPMWVGRSRAAGGRARRAETRPPKLLGRPCGPELRRRAELA